MDLVSKCELTNSLVCVNASHVSSTVQLSQMKLED